MMTMDNTVGAAVKTLREIDGLIERVNLARKGIEISDEDIILIANILDQIRVSILKSTAYPPIEIEGEEVSV